MNVKRKTTTRAYVEPLPEPERYELAEPCPYRFELERREFVAVLGAGILVSVASTPAVAQAQERRGRGRDAGARGDGIAERLHVGADGRITVLTGKVEVGQGSRTQLSMAAAEELGVSLDRIRLVMADSAVVPDDGSSAGSRTTPSTVPRVRRACAAARALLVATAARRWDVETTTVTLREGRIVGSSPEHSMPLGEFVQASFEDGLDAEIEPGVTVKQVEEWNVLGTSADRVGGTDIVTGRHRYPSDIARPGMLYGVVLRPPSFGATLTALDLAPANAMEGVTAVRDGEFVGFAAPTSRAARAARAAAERTAHWEERSGQAATGDLFAHLKEHSAPGSGGRRRRGGPRERGNFDEGLVSAARVLRASYEVAYVQHAPMEPRAAVAEWNDGALTVWTGTQNPGRVRGQLADAFRIDEERVRVIVPDTGGAFGGKHTGEVAVEAARLARAAARPVSLCWSREEEFTWAYFRPAGLLELTGGLDRSGALIVWEQKNYNSGGSALETPYDIRNSRSQYIGSEAPLRQGSYRALASTANVFARESFLDELAAAANADPLAFRLRHLAPGRLRDVLEGVARRFEWERRRKETAGSRTRGVGLACGTEKGSYIATCAEVALDAESASFRVTEVCAVFECGAVHNPANLRAQVEGCIVQGLGAALREEIRFAGGRILNPRFSRYEVPRFRDLPKIDTVLLPRSDLPSVGGGETPIIAIAPAIGNALFAATGEPFRSLPLRSEHYRSL